MSSRVEFMKKLYYAAKEQRMVQCRLFEEDRKGTMYCIAGLAWKLCGMTDNDYRLIQAHSLKTKESMEKRAIASKKINKISHETCPIPFMEMQELQICFDTSGKDALLSLMKKKLLKEGIDVEKQTDSKPDLTVVVSNTKIAFAKKDQKEAV